MKVTSTFKLLLAEKEMREGRNYTLRDIRRATGVSVYTIAGFANGTLREYPSDAIAAFCDFFKCSVGELLIYSEDTESSAQRKSKGQQNPNLIAVSTAS